MRQLDETFNSYEKKNGRKSRLTEYGVKMPKINKEGTQDNLDQLKQQILFFECVASGKDENIDKIINFVKKDPKRNLYDESQKQNYFINQKNHEGFTALYVACRNGHTKIVNVLLKWNGDPLIKCGVIKIIY